MFHVKQTRRNAIKKIAALILIIVTIFMFGCSGHEIIDVVVPTASPSPSPVPSPTQMPTPPPTPVPDPLEEYISGLSIEQLIGQLIMIGFDGMSDIDSSSKKMLTEYYAGNVILFGRNTETFAQTSALIAKINRLNPSPEIPYIITIDIEGGSVTRFKGQWKPFISSAQTLGKANDPERVYKQYTQIGKTLTGIGFNMNLAPVADIARNPSASFLGNRLFGSNPDRVAPLIAKAVEGLHNGGIGSVAKHFPGHGDTAVDSHHAKPVIETSMEEMLDYALVPFQSAVDAGVDCMLVGHILLPELDSGRIASVSPTIITGLLREQMGFDGLVMSDDLRMAALASDYSAGEGAVLFIEAGGDIILIGRYFEKQSDIARSLKAAVDEGRLTRERISESVKRIFEYKLKYCGMSIEGYTAN